MNFFIRPFSLLIFFIFCSSLTAIAQEFPSTKKQAFDWLTASSWKIKWLIIDDRKLAAETINMKVSLSFLSDSTYEMNFMSETRKGNFIIDMEEKYIRLTNDKQSNEILISSLSNNELWAKSIDGGEEEPLMILVNGKKK